MDAQNVIFAAYDSVRNVVRITFAGAIGVDEARRGEEAISDALAGTRRGFYLLTDLSKLISMDVQCMPYITRIMEAAQSRGIAQVVRIIPDPTKDIGLNIMSLFHYRRGLPIVTCENETEADRALK
jgi:hypothetical protein